MGWFQDLKKSDTPSVQPISGKNHSDVNLLKLLLWVELIVTSLRIIIIIPDSALPKKSLGNLKNMSRHLK